MNRFALLFLTITAAVFAAAQDSPKKYWIYFTSKENSALAKSSSPADAARAIGISDRAILRRSKVSKQIITEEDLPVSASFITTLEQRGVKIQNQSRWFNAVTAYLTASQITAIEQFPFVRSIQPVGMFTRTELPQTENHFSKTETATADPDSQLYGKSITHMRSINAIAVHKIGIKGRGVLVGMLDTGFRWKTHEAMQNMISYKKIIVRQMMPVR